MGPMARNGLKQGAHWYKMGSSIHPLHAFWSLSTRPGNIGKPLVF